MADNAGAETLAVSPDEAYQAVVDHADTYESAEARQAFVTAAIAMHIYLTDGQLPGRLGARRASESDSP